MRGQKRRGPGLESPVKAGCLAAVKTHLNASRPTATPGQSGSQGNQPAGGPTLKPTGNLPPEQNTPHASAIPQTAATPIQKKSETTSTPIPPGGPANLMTPKPTSTPHQPSNQEAPKPTPEVKAAPREIPTPKLTPVSTPHREPVVPPKPTSEVQATPPPKQEIKTPTPQVQHTPAPQPQVLRQTRQSGSGTWFRIRLSTLCH